MVKPTAVLSHVAFVLPSVEKAAAVFVQHGFSAGPAELFSGTKEIYIGDYSKHSALPLLMEPTKAGSYSRALEKRGPSLHHIAIDVLNLEAYLDSLASSGWFLHLNSLYSARELQTVYLARPGMPALIEVQEREKLSTIAPLIEEIHMNLDSDQMNMMKSLGLEQIKTSPEPAMVLTNKKIYFKELY